MTTECTINTSGKGWRDYLARRFRGEEPTILALGDLIHTLRDVKAGRLKITMTPDGTFTIMVPSA